MSFACMVKMAIHCNISSIESLASDEVLNIREKDKSFGGGNA